MLRTKRTRATSSTDVAGALSFAEAFRQNLVSIEQVALALIAKERRAGVGLGDQGSAARNPGIAHDFLVQLFGFVSAIRTSRDYICAAVAKTPGASSVRGTRLKANIIVFHTNVANQVLHQNIIDTGRLFYAGGPKDGTFAFIYAASTLDAKSAAALKNIQDEHNSSTGSIFSIIELADLGLAELRKIDEDCRATGYY